MNPAPSTQGRSRSAAGRPDGERGFVAIVFAIVLPVLLGLAGLAVDAAYLRQINVKMKAAADAGAMAGAIAVKQDPAVTQATVETRARADTARLGYTHGTDGVTVTVNRPPASGNYSSQSDAVEVIIAQSRPTFFMRALGVDSKPVGARGVAYASGSGGGCVYALDSGKTSSALKLHPKGGYTLSVGCGVVVNSSASDAINAEGNTLSAKSIDVVGNPGYKSGGTYTPTPKSGMTVAADPLAYLSVTHSRNAATTTDVTVTAGAVLANAQKEITPGSYRNITINGADASCGSAGRYPAKLTLKGPGVFSIFGAWTVTDPKDGKCSALTGDQPLDTKYYPQVVSTGGVTIYVGPAGSVAMGGGMGHWTNAILAAPTVYNASTAPYPGILFFQDRTNTKTLDLSFGASTDCATAPNGLEGALYAFNAKLKISNSSTCSTANNTVSFPKYTVFVADTLEFYRDYGNFYSVGSDFSGLPGGSPIKRAVLSE